VLFSSRISGSSAMCKVPLESFLMDLLVPIGTLGFLHLLLKINLSSSELSVKTKEEPWI